MIPEDLRYTAEHEWVATGGDGPVRVGITDFAQDALGDIVFVQLPEVGRRRSQAGEPFGEVESTKSVSEIYAPVSGEVVARNEALERRAGADQHRPVRRGLAGRARGRPTRRGRRLLDAAGYRELTEDSRVRPLDGARPRRRPARPTDPATGNRR